MPFDARAKQILLNHFWTSRGWRSENETPTADEDFVYARAHGMMFGDRLTIDHDALIERTIAAAGALTQAQVSAAFLASLSTRRCDLRSALATYALAPRTRHAFTVEQPPAEVDPMYGRTCVYCDGYPRHIEEDLDVLNFERHKWGGVRHTSMLYQMLDLELLAREPPSVPTDADRQLLERILKAIATSPSQDRAADLAKRLDGVVPSDKNERNTLIEILSMAGVLRAQEERSGYTEAFQHAGAWRGSDGYDADAVTRLFGMHGIAGTTAAKKRSGATKKTSRAKKPIATKATPKKSAPKKPTAKRSAAPTPARTKASRARGKR